MNYTYNTPVENCYFCGQGNFVPHSEATYWGEFDLHFVECTGCGLIFANPMPGLDAIIEGNRALNIHHGSRGTISQYRGGKEFSLYLRKIQPEGVLLDVGCAEGFFLLGVEENSGWKAEGLDIIESAAEFANTRLGITVHLGTLDGLQSFGERYDFIRMNNVIEHVQDPVQFLRAANALLKKGGRVYCSTPNGFQDGHVLKTANKHGMKLNLLENHFFYYHPDTLKALYRAAGFRILKAYCEDMSHSLKDFGLLPRFRYSYGTDTLMMKDFRDRSNKDFTISDAEIRSYKTDPYVKLWRIRLSRNYFRIHVPASLAIGHQQHVFAEKL